MARCNFDCFHCKYKDCRCNDRPTREETEIMHGAHGGWDLENIVKIYLNLKKLGIPDDEIAERLSIYHRHMYDIKRKATSMMAHEKRQIKDTHTNCTV